MLKWLAGAFGTVLIGVVMWFLTDRLLPRVVPPDRPESPAAAPEILRVECSVLPSTVPPDGRAEVKAQVTLGEKPLERAWINLVADVGVFAEGGTQGMRAHTQSGGTYSSTWIAPSQGGRRYNFTATATFGKGTRVLSAQTRCSTYVGN